MTKKKLIQLFQKYKNLKTFGVPNLVTSKSKNGFGYKYYVYFEKYFSIMVSQKIYYYNSNFSSLIPSKDMN